MPQDEHVRLNNALLPRSLTFRWIQLKREDWQRGKNKKFPWSDTAASGQECQRGRGPCGPGNSGPCSIYKIKHVDAGTSLTVSKTTGWAERRRRPGRRQRGGGCTASLAFASATRPAIPATILLAASRAILHTEGNQGEPLPRNSHQRVAPQAQELDGKLGVVVLGRT